MKRFLYYALICVFCATFLVSVYFIGDYYLESMTTQSGYDVLSNIVEQNKENTSSKPPIIFIPPVIDGGTPTAPESASFMASKSEVASSFSFLSASFSSSVPRSSFSVQTAPQWHGRATRLCPVRPSS